MKKPPRNLVLTLAMALLLAAASSVPAAASQAERTAEFDTKVWALLVVQTARQAHEELAAAAHVKNIETVAPQILRRLGKTLRESRAYGVPDGDDPAVNACRSLSMDMIDMVTAYRTSNDGWRAGTAPYERNYMEDLRKCRSLTEKPVSAKMRALAARRFQLVTSRSHFPTKVTVAGRNNSTLILRCAAYDRATAEALTRTRRWVVTWEAARFKKIIFQDEKGHSWPVDISSAEVAP